MCVGAGEAGGREGVALLCVTFWNGVDMLYAAFSDICMLGFWRLYLRRNLLQKSDSKALCFMWAKPWWLVPPCGGGAASFAGRISILAYRLDAKTKSRRRMARGMK